MIGKKPVETSGGLLLDLSGGDMGVQFIVIH